MKIVATKGDGKVFEEARECKSVSKTNYIDVSDIVHIPQDRVYKHQAVKFCYNKDSAFDPVRHPL